LSAAVLVTVVGPDGLGVDLAVPAEVPVAELLDGLRAALPGPPPALPGDEPPSGPATLTASVWPGAEPPPGPTALAPLPSLPAVSSPPGPPGGEPPSDQLALAPPGGVPLPPARSLAGCGIGDGAVLILRDGPPHEPPPVRPRDQAPRPVPDVTPGWLDRLPTAGWPVPWPLPVRLSRALRASFRGPGWRRSPARGRRAWRDGSYERRLRAALAAAPLARCAVVGVLGATPRAGATTVTALLAAALAAGRPGRTVAVDASPGPGPLTELLAPGHDLFVDELVGLLGHPLLTRRELAATLARRGELAVLAARPGAAAPDERGWTLVVRALAAHATTVVVDCGPGTTAGARAALAAADQIVLVADACSPRTAVAAADLLAERGCRPVLLLNRAPGDLEAGEVVQRVAGVRGAVVLPADPAAAAALGAVPLPADPAAAVALGAAPTPGAPGAPLGRVPLPARWRRQADELAMLLAAEWPSLGLEAG